MAHRFCPSSRDPSPRRSSPAFVSPRPVSTREGAVYYQKVPDTGWVQLRPDRLRELITKKQRAALSQDSLLAAIPSWTDDPVSYRCTDRRSPLPRRFEGRPEPAAESEAARLWDALHARFPGELPADSELPRM